MFLDPNKITSDQLIEILNNQNKYKEQIYEEAKNLVSKRSYQDADKWLVIFCGNTWEILEV